MRPVRIAYDQFIQTTRATKVRGLEAVFDGIFCGGGGRTPKGAIRALRKRVTFDPICETPSRRTVSCSACRVLLFEFIFAAGVNSMKNQYVFVPFMRLQFALALGTVFAVAGCGQQPKTNYDAIDLVQVTGTVKVDGAPANGVTVVFESNDKRTSSGTTNASGKYTLMLDSTKTGVTPGEKTVRIRFGGADGGDAEEGGEDEHGRPKAKKANLPEKYNSKSELKRTVEAGKGPQEFDFDLKSS